MNKYFTEITPEEFNKNRTDVRSFSDKEKLGLRVFSTPWYYEYLVTKDSIVHLFILSEKELDILENFLLFFSKKNQEAKIKFHKCQTFEIKDPVLKSEIEKKYYPDFKNGNYEAIKYFELDKISQGLKPNPTTTRWSSIPEFLRPSTSRFRAPLYDLAIIYKQNKLNFIFSRDDSDWFWVYSKKEDFTNLSQEEEYIRCDDFAGLMFYLKSKFTFL